MTNRFGWIETNDNRAALCPVNIAGKIRLPNSCFVCIFLWVLLHVNEHWHGKNLVCHDVWRFLGFFFFFFFFNAWFSFIIVVYSEDT